MCWILKFNGTKTTPVRVKNPGWKKIMFVDFV